MTPAYDPQQHFSWKSNMQGQGQRQGQGARETRKSNISLKKQSRLQKNAFASDFINIFIHHRIKINWKK